MKSKVYSKLHWLLSLMAIVWMAFVPASMYAASVPTNVHVNDLAPISATLAWEIEGTDRHDYDIRVATSTLTSTELGVATVGNPASVVIADNAITLAEPEYAMSGLTAGTHYYVYIRENADWDYDQSSDWAAYEFSTPCEATAELPIAANFDGSSTIPTCWSTGGKAPTVVGSPHRGESGNAVKISPTSESGSYLYSPVLASNAGAYYLTAYVYGAAGADYAIGIAATEDLLNVQSILEGKISQANTWTFIDVAIPAELQAILEGGVEYVWVFYAEASNNAVNFYVDDIELAGMPPCITPNGLSVSEIAPNSAVISWNERGTATAWMVEYSDGVTTLNAEATGNPSTLLENLAPNTSYTVRVKAVCDEASESEWTAWVSFKTECGQTDVPWSENFDNNPSSDCWILPDGITMTTSTSYAHSGTGVLRFATNVEAIVVLPGFGDLSGKQMSFYYRCEGTSNTTMGYIKAGYITNVNDASSFVMLADYNQHVYSYQEGEIIFGANVPAGARPALLYYGATSASWYLFVDDITVETAPTCPRPSNLVLGEVGTTTAALSWTAGGDESRWKLTYGETEVIVNDEPAYTIEGLGAGAQYSYTVAIQAICSDEDMSAEYSSSISFRTQVDCSGLGLPYSENFNDVTGASSSYYSKPATAMLPDCWSVDETDNAFVYVTSTSTYAVSGNGLLFVGKRDSRVDTAYVYLPTIVADGNVIFTAQYKHESSSYGQLVIGYVTSPEDASTFVEVASPTPAGTFTSTGDIFLPNNNGVIYPAIMFISDPYYYVGMDNVSITLAPSCPAPSAIVGTPKNPTTVNVKITDADAAHAAWEVAIGAAEGFNPDEATIYAIDSKNAQITLSDPMTVGNSYSIAVRAICNEEEISDWRAGADMVFIDWSGLNPDITFSTGASYPWTLAQVDGVWQASSTNVGVANSVSTLTASFEVGDNAKATFSFDYKTGSESISWDYLVIFIDDACDNPDASTSGNYYADFGRKGGTTTVTGSYSIEFTTPGTHRVMWAYKKDGSADGGIDKAIVYNVTFSSYNCIEPTTFTMGTITENSAVLNWNATSADQYKVLLFTEAQTTIDEAAAVQSDVVNTTTKTFEGLAPSTIYYAYVQSLCGEEPSAWSAATQFHTECSAEAIPYSESFENEASLLCWNVKGEPSVVDLVSAAFEGDHAVSVQSDSVGLMLISPRFDAETLAPYVLNMAVRSPAATAISVGVIIDPSDVSTYIDLGEINLPTPNKWNEYSLSLDMLATEDYEEYASAQYLAVYIPTYKTILFDAISIAEPAQCPKPTALHVQPVGEEVVIDWTSDAANHNMEIALGDEPIFSGSVEKPYTPSGLTGNTEYKVRVQAVCDEMISEWTPWMSFKSPCTMSAVPFAENFDSWTGVDPGYNYDEVPASATLPDCWSVSENDNVFVFVTNKAGYRAGSTGNALLFVGKNEGGVDDSICVYLPTLESEGPVIFTADYRHESTSYGMFVIGYVTRAEDATSFVPVATMTPTTAFTSTGEIALPSINGMVYPAIKYYSHPYYFAAIDNVSITEAPSCFKASNLVLGEVEMDHATISWTPGQDEREWVLTFGDSTEVVTDEPTYTFINLKDGTSYSWNSVTIQGVCSVEDSAEVYRTSLSFRTPIDCSHTDLPWSEDFENNPSSDCWILPAGITMTTSTDYAHSGTGVLKFATMADTMAVLPNFGDLNGKQMKFYYRCEGSSNTTMGYIKAGYVTNPSDESTFVELADYDTHVYSYEEALILFGDNVPAGARPAFLYYGATSAAWYLFVDDIDVEEVPSCERPSALTLEEASGESLRIAISHMEGVSAWEYAVNSVDGAIEAIDQDVFEITGLTAQTAYTVYVRTVCDENVKSGWRSAIFRTACGLSTLPMSENFDDLTSGIPDCWDNSNYTCNASYRWQYNSSYQGHSGKGLTFDAYWATNGTTSTLLTPHYTNGDIPYLKLSFYMKNGGNATLDVKVSTDGGVTFPITLVSNEKGSTNWQQFEYIFGAAANSDIVVSFKATSDYGGYRMVLDEVTIEQGPSCVPLADIVASNISSEEMDIVMGSISGLEPASYDLVISEEELDESELEDAQIINVTEATYHAQGLTPETEYHIYARGNCGEEDGVTEWLHITASTNPTCMPLVYLAANNVTRVEMDIVMLAIPGAEDAVRELVISEEELNLEELEAADKLTLTESTYHASGLTRETTYYIYARVNCGEEDGVSPWKTITVRTQALVEDGDVVVADGTSTISNLPVFGGYMDMDLHTQSIYPATMLTELVGRTITSINYYVYSGSSSRWSDAVVSVKIGITDQSSLATGFITSGLSEVYRGTLDASVANGMTITFNTPFVYTGGNLVIDFENIDVASSYGSCTFYGISAEAGTSRIFYYEYDEYDDEYYPVEVSLSALPKIDFVYHSYAEACPAVELESISHELTGNGTSSAIIRWGESDGDYANSYDLYYATEAVQDFTDVVPQHDSIEALSFELTELSEDTEYYVYIRTNCDGEGQSDGSSNWSDAYVFRTFANCQALSGLYVELLSKTSAQANWDATVQAPNFQYILSEEELDAEDLETAQLTEAGLVDTFAVMQDLTPGTTYYFYVANRCGEEEENHSVYVSTSFTMPATCPAIENLVAYYQAFNAVGLKWNRGRFGEESEWEVGIVGEESSAQAVYDSTAIIIGLQPSTDYIFYVKAVCGVEDSSTVVTLAVHTDPLPSDNVTVADGTTTSSYVPVNGLWCDDPQRSQSIYPASMLTNLVGQPITGLHYYVSSGSSTGTNGSWEAKTFVVRIGTTTNNDLASDWVTETLNVVYTGTLTASEEDGMTVTFDAPFTYNGGNLVIEFDLEEDTPGYASCDFYGVTLTSASRYVRSSNYPDGVNGVVDFLPKVEFQCVSQVTCRQAANVQASDITINSAKLTWFPGGSEVEWAMINSDVELTDAQLNAMVADTLDVMEKSYDGLTPGIFYHFYIRSLCGEGDASGWKHLQYRTIPTCIEPVMATPLLIDADSVVLTWTSGNETFGGTYSVAYGLSANFNLADAETYTLIENIADDQYIIHGLSGSSKYRVAVKAVCTDDDESIWSEPIEFWSACERITNLPFVEDFNEWQGVAETYGGRPANAILPNCWSADEQDDAYVYVTNSSSYAVSGNGLLFVGKQNNSSIDSIYVYMPSIEAEGAVVFTAKYRHESSSYGKFVIGYVTTPEDASTFVAVATLTPSSSFVSTDKIVIPSVDGVVYPVIKHITKPWYYASMDSIVISKLAVAATYYDQTCSGTAYQGHGFDIPASQVVVGEHTFTRVEEATSDLMADSLYTLVLNVGESKVTYLTDTACAYSAYDNYGFHIGSVNPNRTTPYERHEATVTGCDSLISLTLFVPQREFEVSDAICEGQEYQLGDTTLTTSGTYTRTLTGARFGCDSVVTLTLEVLPAHEEIEATICEGESYPFDGEDRTEAGTYEATLVNRLGCEYTVTLTLAVTEKTYYSYEAVFCAGDIYSDENFNGLDEGGLYKDTLSSVAGCDSIIVLNLIKHEPEEVDLNIEIADGDVYVFDNKTFDHDTTYTAHFVDQFSCDSIVTLHLTVATGLQEVLNDAQLKGAEKFMHNGILYIRANGILYDARGKRVMIRKEEE